MTDQNGRLQDQPDVIRFCQQEGLPAVVVGKWVWVFFSAKPTDRHRQCLKTAGFRWVKNRQGWAHNCGYYSKPARGYDPRDKYGAVPVGSFTEKDMEEVA